MEHVVVPVPTGKMVDTNTKLTSAVVQRVKAAGFIGIARYVTLPGNDPKKDIDARELDAILDGGLALLLVQHVRFPHWDPGQHSGETDARSATAVAKAAGYLPGAHIFLDLEGITAGKGAATKTFAEAWAATVAAAGYAAGCYVGFDVPLTAQELFDLHTINSYWSDAGPRHVAVRGFAIKQGPEIEIAGVKFDPDTIQRDLKGETPRWMAPGPIDIA